MCHHNSCTERKWQDFKQEFGITMQKAESSGAARQCPELQPGAANLAEFINAARGAEHEPITVEMILQEAQRLIRTSATARSGEWKHYYTNGETLIVGCGLSIDEARPILREYNARHKNPKSEPDLETILLTALQKAQRQPEKIGHLMRGKEVPNIGDDDQQESFLNNLVLERCALWHDSDRHPYATVDIGDHRETMQIKSGTPEDQTAFESWLDSSYYQIWEDLSGNGRIPSVAERLTAIRLAQGHAIHKGPMHDVFLRVAPYVDPGKQRRENLPRPDQREMGSRGNHGYEWRIIPDPPVKFRRPAGMRPLPTPIKGAKLDLLREWWIMADSDWQLLVGYLTMLLHPKGPYPILIVSGESGSAKTTFCETLRKLVDPSKAELNLVPSTERDVIIATNNSWVVAYDNLSFISEHVSDMLCCVATGMGSAPAHCTATTRRPSSKPAARSCSTASAISPTVMTSSNGAS